MDDRFESVDALEQRFIELEDEIGARRAEQLELIRRFDEAQVHLVDGCRTVAEWLAQRFDWHPRTAKRLLRTARSATDVLAKELAEGHVSTDRAITEAKLIGAGIDDDARLAARGLDLLGAARYAARALPITAADEQHAHLARHFASQRKLDGTSGRFWGEAPAVDIDVIERALDERADELYTRVEDRPARTAQRLDAFVAMAQDTLAGGNGPSSSSTTVAVVTVDAAAAVVSDGEQGGEVLTGGRIGPAILERILCSETVEVNLRHADGAISPVGPSRGALTPRQRRRILTRDGGQCQIEGCTSVYRLQPHHIVERSRGGTNEDDNLVTLCWTHHHRMIHGEGRRLDPSSPPHRRRFLRRAVPEPDD